MAKLYQFCFGSNNDSGSSKGIEPYQYRRQQNALEIQICREYRISGSEYDGLTIEEWYKYQNGYFERIESEAKTNS
jgi:hypothetical protein